MARRVVEVFVQIRDEFSKTIVIESTAPYDVIKKIEHLMEAEDKTGKGGENHGQQAR